MLEEDKKPSLKLINKPPIYKTRSVTIPARDELPNYEEWFEVHEFGGGKYFVCPNIKFPKGFDMNELPTVQIGIRKDLEEAIRDANDMIANLEEWLKAS